ncbi:Putative ribonuclease H protein At1g65750 [Linum perenne]
MSGNEGWDFTKINSLLPAEIVEQIAGKSPPREELGEDTFLWGENRKGIFTIKSAYNLVANQSSSNSDPGWDKIWKWRGPHRVKFFLWLAIHNRLLTNAERTRRHLTPSPTCSRYNSPNESVSHALRDCPIATEIWRRLGFPVDHPAQWIRNGLGKENILLFGITAWFMWKARNDSIFLEVNPRPLQLAIQIHRWTEVAIDPG